MVNNTVVRLAVRTAKPITAGKSPDRFTGYRGHRCNKGGAASVNAARRCCSQWPPPCGISARFH